MKKSQPKKRIGTKTFGIHSRNLIIRPFLLRQSASQPASDRAGEKSRQNSLSCAVSRFIIVFFSLHRIPFGSQRASFLFILELFYLIMSTSSFCVLSCCSHFLFATIYLSISFSLFASSTTAPYPSDLRHFELRPFSLF